ncbi:hypothetical protein DDI_3606 [Dickeya dianthicola RNS04.9]|nr:hypothetical protein DDI_3606 [Dickeya dianthicola RNS04.9]
MASEGNVRPYPQKHTSTIESKRLLTSMSDETIKITPKTASGIVNG